LVNYWLGSGDASAIRSAPDPSNPYFFDAADIEEIYNYQETTDTAVGVAVSQYTTNFTIRIKRANAALRWKTASADNWILPYLGSPVSTLFISRVDDTAVLAKQKQRNHDMSRQKQISKFNSAATDLIILQKLLKEKSLKKMEDDIFGKYLNFTSKQQAERKSNLERTTETCSTFDSPLTVFESIDSEDESLSCDVEEIADIVVKQLTASGLVQTEEQRKARDHELTTNLLSAFISMMDAKFSVGPTLAPKSL